MSPNYELHLECDPCFFQVLSDCECRIGHWRLVVQQRKFLVTPYHETFSSLIWFRIADRCPQSIIHISKG